MNPLIGWGLAALAIGMGYVQWGWQGAVLGLTLVVFWLLLQFSRVMRVMRMAADAPVGHVANAVMLNSTVSHAMRLLEILPLTRSLGRKLADDPETFEWSDAAGDRVVIELVKGRCTQWRLERNAAAEAPAGATPADA